MTHLSDRKRLIEEAAKAMANGGHNVIGWGGHSEDEQDWYRSDATIALSVFEEALDASGNQGAIVNSIIERTRHEATDDEVNAVALAYWGPSVTYDREKLRTALAGFRRSEVPEPSAEDAFAPGECTGAGDCDALIHVHGCYRPHRADQCDAPEEYGHLPGEPQGEPSDAQVVAAIRKVVDDTPDIREPDTWWPLGLDSEEFKRGAQWAENWWRIQIARAFEAEAR